jgi:hypothetical protein
LKTTALVAPTVYLEQGRDINENMSDFYTNVYFLRRYLPQKTFFASHKNRGSFAIKNDKKKYEEA